MSEVKWIRITTGMFEDEKIDYIESLPEGDSLLIIWIKLLTLAGKCNSNGFIFLTENIPYTEDTLSHKFRRSLNVIKFALHTFENLGMIFRNEEGFIAITNWEKHQNVEGLDRIRQQNRLRKQKEREKKNLLAAPTDLSRDSHVTSHPSHATDIDIELDIDKDIDKELNNNIIILTSEQAQFFSILKAIKNYPFDQQKDLEMFNRLAERYPTLDLIESLKTWSIYKLDKPLKDKDNPRSQINTSFKNYVSWGKNLKGVTSKSYGKSSKHNAEEHDQYANADIRLEL